MKHLLLLLLPAVLAAAGLEERITEYDLANGLHVIIYVDSAAPVVSTNAWYRVGAYDEPLGHTGLSHMLEHMTFKHTDRYEPGTFHRIVEDAGGYNNGFTSTSYTGYFEDLASDRWELALELEAARMARCTFEDDEFAREREVVAEERRLRENQPTSEFWEKFEALAYIAHPNRQPILGWMDDIQHYDVAMVSDWYARHYNPANAVLVVAGDVRVDEARRLIAKHFGGLQGEPVTRADYYGLEPPQGSERRLVLRRDVMTPILMLGYHSPGIRDSARFAGDVLAGILGRGRTSRLYRRLVTESGLATSVWVSNSVSRDPGLFYIHVYARDEQSMPEIERLVDQEIARLQEEPVTGYELEKFRNRVLADDIFDRDDVSDLAYYLAAYTIAEDDWRAFERYPQGIASVTADAVREFSRTWLTADNRTVGMLLPRGEER